LKVDLNRGEVQANEVEEMNDVHDLSFGIPRKIGAITEQALTYAMFDQKRTVTAEMVLRRLRKTVYFLLFESLKVVRYCDQSLEIMFNIRYIQCSQFYFKNDNKNC